LSHQSRKLGLLKLTSISTRPTDIVHAVINHVKERVKLKLASHEQRKGAVDGSTEFKMISECIMISA